MTTRSFLWRLSGVSLIGAAAGSSLLHRGVLAGAAGAPATAVEMGLGLLSFLLASAGIMLVIHGPHLVEERHQTRARERRDAAEGAEASEQRQAIDIPASYDDCTDRASFGSDRFAVAAGLVRSALDHGCRAGSANGRSGHRATADGRGQ